MKVQPLAGIFVDNRQDSDPFAVDRLVLNEVPAPHMSLMGRLLPLGRALPPASHLALALAHLKALITAYSLHSFRVHLVPVTLHQCCDATVPVSRIVLRHRYDLLFHLFLALIDFCTTVHSRTRYTQRPACLRTTSQSLGKHILQCPSLRQGTHHFFEFTSFRISICTAWSAMIRFKWDTSSLIARN